MIKALILLVVLCVLLPQIVFHTVAQGGAIQLAVDTANVNQDGLLVIFGGLRLQGEVGLPVAAGDINGDGRGDVVFCGMFGSSVNRDNNGVVNFYLSDGRDTGIVDTAQNLPNIFKLAGQRSGDLLGTSVSAVGDVNGDGIRDVAIGAAGWDGPGAGIADNRGAAYVVLGSTNFNLNADLADSNPPPGIISIYGPQAGGRMGIWIDEGDVDGDGFADIVIGSDQINTDAGQHAGGAYIVFGSPSLPSVIDLANVPAGVRIARILGSHQEDHWGAALQVGDINNDGIGDVIIGGSINRDSASYTVPNPQPNDPSGHDARAADDGGLRPQCGEAYVIYGQHNWPEVTDLRNPDAANPVFKSTHVIGAHEFDFLGSQLHSGDLNGDGRTDLVIGALRANAPDNQGQPGAVYVIYGSPTLAGATIDLANPDTSGQRVSTIYGEHHLDCAGDSVRTFDINKDGLSDLFIGSPERTFVLNGEDRDDAGVTEIIYGQRDFLPPVIKLYDPPAAPPIFRLAGAHGEDQGIDGGDEFSYRLAGADIDGDGYIDYIANAMHGDGLNNGVPNGGNVYIFSGRKLSTKIGMIQPQQPPAPVLISASLLLNGQAVQQAPAGQSGLSITVHGTGLGAGGDILINGISVIWHAPIDPQPYERIINLDENTAIRNSAGSLKVRARITTPLPSDLSNEVTAGSLVGPQITNVKVKKKPSGALILKISGANFPTSGEVSVLVADQQLALQSTDFSAPDFIQAKIGAGTVPASGTSMRIKVITAQGIQSNEVIATAK